MASDLIERLRSHMAMQDVSILLADCREAADTIERYEAALRRIEANKISLIFYGDDISDIEFSDEDPVTIADAALRSQDKGEG